jgi:hypothetical protein
VNNFYQYSYKNGLQFVTTVEPLLIGVALQRKFDEISPIEVPKLIGVWKFKEIKIQKNKTK